MSSEILSHIFRMSPMWAVIYFLFVAKGNVIPDDEAMTGFILHQSNPPCRDVDTNKELKPCTLSSLEDYLELRYGDPSCPAAQCQARCKDGSYSMTCMPLSLQVEYLCACAEVKGDINAGIAWNDTWEEISGDELSFKRGLCDLQAGWCMDGMFKMNLTYLIKMYAPLDTQITASSVFSSIYETEKVKLYQIDAFGCAWIKAKTDQSPWIMFDFLQIRVAIGVIIAKRCDKPDQYVTSFRASTMDENNTWSYIGTDVGPDVGTDVGPDVQTQYDGLIFTWWFGREVAARCWRIEPVTWNNHAAMQAEFLGYA